MLQYGYRANDKNRRVLIMEHDFDLTKLFEGYSKEQIDGWNEFYHPTFNKITATTNNTGWRGCTVPVNNFFKMLTQEQQEQFFVFMVSAKMQLATVKTHKDKKFDNKIKEIGTAYSELLINLDVFAKLKEIVLNTPTSYKEDAGKRPQDQANITWTKDEIDELATLVLITKLTVPLYMAIITKYSQFNIFSIRQNKMMSPQSAGKEYFAASVLAPYIQDNLMEVYDKLHTYVQHNLNKTVADTPVYVFRGHTVEVATMTRMDNLLVKDYPNMDLYGKPNAITYTSVIVRCNSKNLEDKVPQLNEPMLMSISSDDDENKSFQDLDVKYSDTNTDTPVYLRFMGDVVASQFIKERKLDQEAYERVVDRYARNPIPLNTLNGYLLVGLFGNDLGGGRAIRMLDATSIRKLVSAMQLDIFDRGYYKLGQLVTAYISDSGNRRFDGDSIALKRNVSITKYDAFKSLPALLTLPTSDAWKNKLVEIKDWMAINTFIGNTAESYIDKFELPNINNEVLTPGDNEFSEIGLYIHDIVKMNEIRYSKK